MSYMSVDSTCGEGLESYAKKSMARVGKDGTALCGSRLPVRHSQT